MKPSKRVAIFSFVLSAFLLLSAFLTASYAEARIGVGMGSSEIRITDSVKPGGIYKLPTLRIFNTGDETTTYGMDVSYHEDYKQIRPAPGWFTFSPTTFTLDAGKSQDVSITMVVPVKAVPGDYFAFLEGGPVSSNKPGTTVGVAVAAKLFFTVAPANIFQAALYRISSFFSAYSPWTWIVLGLVLCAVVVYLFRRFFSLSFAVRKR
ncbi:MAG: hypothetical protein ABSF56_02705 [Minisyncoccia bacterium]|jgi:P pilus assembly chaperone PapD